MQTVLVVGHNPTLSTMTQELDPGAARDSDGLSTCGIAVHEVDGSWSALHRGDAPLVAAHTARAED
jgi:phosphohistidine phosphatase